MKPSRASFDRLKKMLVDDKIGAGDGFLSIFKTEITRLVKDYFVLDGDVDIKIEIDDFGNNSIAVRQTPVALDAGMIKDVKATICK